MFQNNLMMAAASASGAPVAITYTDNDTVVGSASAFTFSSVALGTAATDRRIVVGVWGHGAVTAVSTVTVGGVSGASVVVLANADDSAEIWIADVPTGTTGDIVVTWVGTKAATSIMVWGMTGASFSANDTGSSTANPLTDTVTIPANGGVIARAASASSSTFTWTNADEDAEYVANTVGQSGAHKNYVAEQTDLAITATASSPSASTFAVASWGPSTGFMKTTGGTETTDGDYKVITFTSSGTFTITKLGDYATVEYLVIAGGGSGGFSNGGGGGAGGFRVDTAHTVTAKAYTITVGAGGAAASALNTYGSDGGTSTFDTISSSGGGTGGAGGASGSGTGNGKTGGSGGGGRAANSGGSGGAGNSGSFDPVEGYAGGSGTFTAPNYGAGGGGGSGGVGANGSGSAGGNGGIGTANSITGSSVTYASGGGGSAYNGGTVGTASAGGGTDGESTSSSAADDAEANTGGGGGAGGKDVSGSAAGGAGGSGVVIIRYKFQ